MEEKFGNYCTIIGDVANRDTKDIGDSKDKLGKLALSLGNNDGYVDVWNPKSADNNKVIEFFKKLDNNQRIQVQGSLNEDYYQGDYKRKMRAFVSGSKGVTFKTVDKEPKFVAALNGNILNRELRYENVERFDEDDVAKMEIRLAIFSLYNPETRENDLEPHEVLLNKLNNYKDYLERSDDEDTKAYKTTKKLIEKAENSDDIETQTKVLNKFYDLFNPRMFNIDILHLTAYKDIAEELANKAEKYDNVGLGVQVNNYQDVDEFGVTTGYINEIEIKKIYEVNKREDADSDDDSFLDSEW